jgi:hypothetical protein
LLLHSGLHGNEREEKFTDLRDVPGDVDGFHAVLRRAGQTIVAQAMGFATIYAHTGTAKSRWARALTVGLCGKGIPTRYVHGKDLEKALFGEGEGRELDTIARDMHQNIQALIVDEADKINWKNEWIGAEMSHLFDARYRNAAQPSPLDRQITVFVAQYHPREWAPDFLLSRITDGSFAIPWPDDLIPPTSITKRPCNRLRCAGTMIYNGQICICDQCGSQRLAEIYWPFEIRTGDMRQVLPSRYAPALPKRKQQKAKAGEGVTHE